MLNIMYIFWLTILTCNGHHQCSDKEHVTINHKCSTKCRTTNDQLGLDTCDNYHRDNDVSDDFRKPIHQIPISCSISGEKGYSYNCREKIKPQHSDFNQDCSRDQEIITVSSSIFYAPIKTFCITDCRPKGVECKTSIYFNHEVNKYRCDDIHSPIKMYWSICEFQSCHQWQVQQMHSQVYTPHGLSLIPHKSTCEPRLCSYAADNQECQTECKTSWGRYFQSNCGKFGRTKKEKKECKVDKETGEKYICNQVHKVQEPRYKCTPQNEAIWVLDSAGSKSWKETQEDYESCYSECNRKPFNKENAKKLCEENTWYHFYVDTDEGKGHYPCLFKEGKNNNIGHKVICYSAENTNEGRKYMLGIRQKYWSNDDSSKIELQQTAKKQQKKQSAKQKDIQIYQQTDKLIADEELKIGQELSKIKKSSLSKSQVNKIEKGLNNIVEINEAHIKSTELLKGDTGHEAFQEKQKQSQTECHKEFQVVLDLMREHSDSIKLAKRQYVNLYDGDHDDDMMVFKYDDVNWRENVFLYETEVISMTILVITTTVIMCFMFGGLLGFIFAFHINRKFENNEDNNIV